jgi:hypothetical protein
MEEIHNLKTRGAKLAANPYSFNNVMKLKFIPSGENATSFLYA